jgi:hypothetical protein
LFSPALASAGPPLSMNRNSNSTSPQPLSSEERGKRLPRVWYARPFLLRGSPCPPPWRPGGRFLFLWKGRPTAQSRRIAPLAQSRRDCTTQPRVARNELPWDHVPKSPDTLKGLHLLHAIALIVPAPAGPADARPGFATAYPATTTIRISYTNTPPFQHSTFSIFSHSSHNSHSAF